LERRTLHLAIVGVCIVGLGACGGGERQDEGAPEGDFRVETTADFPSKQSVGKTSNLVITVANAETDKTLPNVAVTVNGLTTRVDNPNLADPNRPVFVFNGEPVEVGGLSDAKPITPEGGDTAFTNTWALGPIKPGQRKQFRWKLTAVRPGPYDINYKVAAGLYGKAKAVDPEGNAPSGQFKGTIARATPDVRISDDGKTVVTK
jgi:hypothetical protein